MPFPSDTSYDEKDDASYVVSESEGEVSLISDYDITNEYEKLTFIADDTMDQTTNDDFENQQEESESPSEKLVSGSKKLGAATAIAAATAATTGAAAAAVAVSSATAVNATATATATGIVHFLIKHEIPRKVFHSLHGFVTLGLYINGWSKYDAAKVVWTLFAFVFANDVIRLNFPEVNEAVLPYVQHFMREHEAKTWNGITFYLAGAGLVLSFAPKDIAVMSICLLSWADTAASTVGRAFGRYTPSVGDRKSLAGCMASALTGLCVCYFFYSYIVPEFPGVSQPGEHLWSPETSHLNIHAFALVTGLITSFSEAVDIGQLDDNFTIPVLCSLGLSAVAYLARK